MGYEVRDGEISQPEGTSSGDFTPSFVLKITEENEPKLFDVMTGCDVRRRVGTSCSIGDVKERRVKRIERHLVE